MIIWIIWTLIFKMKIMNIYKFFAVFFLLNQGLVLATKEYCQPGETCWPTTVEIEEFKSYLTPKNEECHGLPTFSSLDEPGKSLIIISIREILISFGFLLSKLLFLIVIRQIVIDYKFIS